MHITADEPTVMITIGNHLALGLDQHNNLLIHSRETNGSVNLGPLTQQRAKELGEYLQRLAIHTPER